MGFHPFSLSGRSLFCFFHCLFPPYRLFFFTKPCELNCTFNAEADLTHFNFFLPHKLVIPSSKFAVYDEFIKSKGDNLTMNKQKSLSDVAAVAQFRFALITPVNHDLFSDAPKTAYYKRGTVKPLKMTSPLTEFRINSMLIMVVLTAMASRCS